MKAPITLTLRWEKIAEYGDLKACAKHTGLTINSLHRVLSGKGGTTPLKIAKILKFIEKREQESKKLNQQIETE